LGRKQYVQFLSFANRLDFDRQLRLLRLCNVGYVVSFRELSASGISLAGRFPRYYSWLYKISESVPRAYVVNKGKVVKDSADVLPSVSDPKFDPTQEVVLEDDVAINPNRPLQATAKIVRYEDTVVVVHVNSNDDGVLVLTDSYYPGWHAYVDGKRTKILRANHFFRGVSVLAGRHVIEFKYEPQSFRLGLLISLLTVFCILVISVSLLVRRFKDLSDPPNPSKTEGFEAQQKRMNELQPY
jgi:Bacterial membrane protein YfhO